MARDEIPLNMRTPRERFDVHRPRMRAVANLLRKNVPISATNHEMAQMAGLTPNQIDVTARLMIFIGALDRGRQRWTLLKDGAELDRAIDLEMERQMRGGLSPESIRDKKKARAGVTRRSAERVAVVEDRHQEPIAAVVGPEPTPPIAAVAQGSDAVRRATQAIKTDDAHSLVLAAKQYRLTGGITDEVRKAREAIDALSGLGVEVPDALRQKAVTVRNDRLHAIADVLPYVEALERQVVGLGDQLRQMADYGELKQYRERHRREHQQQVADRVADAMRQEARK